MKRLSRALGALLFAGLSVGLIAPPSAQAVEPQRVTFSQGSDVLLQAAAATVTKRDLMMHFASLGRGWPYTWGGGHAKTPGPSLGNCGSSYEGPTPCIDNTVKGFDCSGFVRYVIDAAGLGNYAYNANGFRTTSRATTIARSKAQPGDLILFGPSKTNATHIAVYAGTDSNGVAWMFEAASHALDTTYSKVSRRSDIIMWRTIF
jgi:cell wall-associated NlpC family hydrolase